MLRSIRPLSLSSQHRRPRSILKWAPAARRMCAGAALLSLLLPGCKRSPASNPKSAEPVRQAKGPKAKQAAKKEAAVHPDAIDLFAFGRQLGAIAPCGCTADPLGGLQYAFGYIEGHSDPERRAILQGGSFLFPDPNGPDAAKEAAEWGQIEQRAQLLTRAFTRFGPQLHLGIGPTDYSSPAGAKALTRFSAPRSTSNLPAKSAPQLKAWRTMDLAPGVTAGVTHIIDPGLGSKVGVSSMPKVSDPAAALAKSVKEIQSAGHDLVIVTFQSQRPFAESLLRRVPGIDLAVLTGPIDDLQKARLGGPPALVNQTWLVQPGDQAQTISHLRLFVPKDLLSKAKATPKADLIGPASQWAFLASKSQRDAEAQRLRSRLATFEKDPDADASFLARMRADLQKLQAAPPLPKDKVALRIEAAKVTCRGEAAAPVQKELEAYDQWVAQSNKKRFTGVKAPPAAKGQPHYVGDATCRNCHAQAFAFWQKTQHAGAFATLEKANKEYDLNCVSCHVTGYRKPGGSHLVENQGLRNVQCEQCHGPGSKHAKTASKAAIQRNAPESLCKGCHTPEHSDTFEYKAYLRDVLGAGHGQAARKALGEGPTGHQLRQAALKKAGGACKK